VIGGHRHVELVGSDGRGAIVLDAGGGDAWSPVWSPDGSRIAFLSSRLGRVSLFVSTLTGSAVHVGSPAGMDAQPSWSADGSRLAFASTLAGDTDVWVVGVTGAGLARLTTSADAESSPSWAPDSSRIVYARNGGQPGVWTIRPDGGGAAPLWSTSGLVGRTRWSPGGARIAFIGPGCADGKHAVHVMDADGSDGFRLACGSLLTDSSESWSPDGTRILFIRSGRIDGQLYRRDAVAITATRRTYTSRVGFVSPVWAPDGVDIAGVDPATDVAAARPLGANRRVIHPSSHVLGQAISWQPLTCTSTGTGGADRLLGTPGNDVICALRGNDRVGVGDGSDTLSGGYDLDTLDLSSLGSGATAGLVRGAVNYGATLISGFESITGSAHADLLNGDDFRNEISGGSGDDRISGGPGRDRLIGGHGNDVVNGRDGRLGDLVAGGPGSDICFSDRGDTRASCAPPLSSLHTHTVPWLTLRQLSSCFYVSAPPGLWPLVHKLARHPVRSGLNDPRSSSFAHFGVDIEAANRASAYAMNGGTILANIRRGTWDESFRIQRYFYYHVNLPSGRGDGSYIAQGGALGPVNRVMKHVHISETTTRCRLVDPRRPTGVLRDPANTERPLISTVSAYAATPAAYAPFNMHHPGSDPSKRLSLGFLHGIVDLRATVADIPKHRTTYAPQQQMMVAGIRSYLAPVGHPYATVGRVKVPLRGAGVIPRTAFFHVYARPTKYVAVCEYNNTLPCDIHLVLHAAGLGFETRGVPNGDYQYCVTAVTIRNVAGIRCTPVTIWNAKPSIGSNATVTLPTPVISQRVKDEYACLNAAPSSRLAHTCTPPPDGDRP
jgi:Ca2+-binding RTX toxin-like protein